jgi:Ca2+-binding RTX toxin-like protein
MATLYAGTEGPVRMDTADISTWLSGSVYDSSPTHMSISSPGGSYRIFGGTGFTFGPSGIFTGGTVTSFYVSTGAGGEPTGVVGMSMSVATLKNYVSTGNSDGFLAAVFANNDTLNGHSYYAFDDFLRGYNGHDVINGGAGNDTLWGDAGNDKLNGGIGNTFFRAAPGRTRSPAAKATTRWRSRARPTRLWNWRVKASIWFMRHSALI